MQTSRTHNAVALAAAAVAYAAHSTHAVTVANQRATPAPPYLLPATAGTTDTAPLQVCRRRWGPYPRGTVMQHLLRLSPCLSPCILLPGGTHTLSLHRATWWLHIKQHITSPPAGLLPPSHRSRMRCPPGPHTQPAAVVNRQAKQQHRVHTRGPMGCRVQILHPCYGLNHLQAHIATGTRGSKPTLPQFPSACLIPSSFPLPPLLAHL